MVVLKRNRQLLIDIGLPSEYSDLVTDSVLQHYDLLCAWNQLICDERYDEENISEDDKSEVNAGMNTTEIQPFYDDSIYRHYVKIHLNTELDEKADISVDGHRNAEENRAITDIGGDCTLEYTNATETLSNRYTAVTSIETSRFRKKKHGNDLTSTVSEEQVYSTISDSTEHASQYIPVELSTTGTSNYRANELTLTDEYKTRKKLDPVACISQGCRDETGFAEENLAKADIGGDGIWGAYANDIDGLGIAWRSYQPPLLDSKCRMSKVMGETQLSSLNKRNEEVANQDDLLTKQFTLANALVQHSLTKDEISNPMKWPFTASIPVAQKGLAKCHQLNKRKTTKIISQDKTKPDTKTKGNSATLWIVKFFIGYGFKDVRLGSCLLTMMICCMPVTAFQQPLGGNVVFPESHECIPTITDSTPDEDGFRQIECEISRCNKVEKIIFEKTGVFSSTDWTPVFEGLNRTHYRSLETGHEYSLNHRADYTAFHTKHLLYIRPLVFKDEGGWRCVVYGDSNKECTSKPVDVIKYVTPGDDCITIAPSNPKLVNGQIAQFTCSATGIHPEPEVVWTINGIEYATGTADNHKHTNGLWSVRNTFKWGFDDTGAKTLTCVMKTKTKALWLQGYISIDVKESVDILEPKNDMNIATNGNFTFTLLCSGTGFNARIVWKKDGIDISDDNERYNMQSKCDYEKCANTITPRLADPENACFYIEDYAGVYTCAISLKPPYTSAHESPNMNVYVPQKLCNGKPSGLLIGLVISMALCAVSVVTTVVVLLFMRRNSRRYMEANQVTL